MYVISGLYYTNLSALWKLRHVTSVPLPRPVIEHTTAWHHVYSGCVAHVAGRVCQVCGVHRPEIRRGLTDPRRWRTSGGLARCRLVRQRRVVQSGMVLKHGAWRASDHARSVRCDGALLHWSGDRDRRRPLWSRRCRLGRRQHAGQTLLWLPGGDRLGRRWMLRVRVARYRTSGVRAGARARARLAVLD